MGVEWPLTEIERRSLEREIRAAQLAVNIYADIGVCHHTHQELRLRIDRAGRKFYSPQCLACGRPAQAVKGSVVLALDPNPLPYDEELYEREADKRSQQCRDRQSFYNDHLLSDYWRTIRIQVFERDGYTCQFMDGDTGRYCDGPATDCHHKTYKRLGNERVSDLKALCRDCHERISSDSAYRLKEAIEAEEDFEANTDRAAWCGDPGEIRSDNYQPDDIPF